MKKISSRILCCILTIILTFSIFSINAYAAQVIVADTPTRYAQIPTYDGKGSCSGIAIRENAEELFVAKASSEEDDAILYYFPNIQNKNNYYIYIISNAGHANAMTIDTNYIYITAWKKDKTDLNQYNDQKNDVIRLSLSYIYNHMTATINTNINNVPNMNSSNTGCTRFSAVKLDSSNNVVNYNAVINSISRYQNDGEFIINYTALNETVNSVEYRGFTKASIENIGGTQKFVVSTSNNDAFTLKKNWNSEDPTYQDLEYSEDNGFFLPIWYGKDSTANTNKNTNKNVLAWADIDHPTSSNSQNVTISGVSYKCFIPDKINVNVSSVKKSGTNIYIYKKFEMESLAFDATGQMYAAVNVGYTSDYLNTNPNYFYREDGVYKINHNNGQNFILD